MLQLIIATGNPGKVEEFRDLLADCGWEVVSPEDLGLRLDVAETGSTYEENARLKAKAFSEVSGFAALADDSGLEVDALNGEPGPLHHLRGWDAGNPADRIQLLLDALRAVPPDQRTARFRTALVLVLPGGAEVEVEGACEGIIATSASGAEGFGYDPVFFLPALGKTMAELSLQEKNQVSHRAIAAAKLRDKLRQLSLKTA